MTGRASQRIPSHYFPDLDEQVLSPIESEQHREPEKVRLDIDAVVSSFALPVFAVDQSPPGKTVFIQNLRHPFRKLARPIPVFIQEDRGQYLAISYDVGQYGAGPSEEDAIHDLCSVLVEYFDLLLEEKSKLGKRLRAHLHYLRSLIEATDATEERASVKSSPKATI